MYGTTQGKFRRVFSLLIISSMLLLMATIAAATDKTKNAATPEIVRISSLQGDVRLSRGDGKHADLNKDWEQAEVNVPLETGFSIATGAGRAEIELENGSLIYLADNSLLIFEKLDVNDGVPATAVQLSTGTMTLFFDPAPKETLTVHTPEDELTFSKKAYLRVDSFLDATSVTPVGEKGEDVVRRGQRTIHLAKGQTITTRNGYTLPIPVSSREQFSLDLAEKMPLVNSPMNSRLGMREEERKAASAELTPLAGSQQAPSTSTATTPISVPAFTPVPSPTALPTFALTLTPPPPPPVPSPAPADWDGWVDARLNAREADITAALKASGLPQYMPGLTDMYEQGVFFPCEGYGQCWEPKDQHETNELNSIDETGNAGNGPVLQTIVLKTGGVQAPGQQTGGQSGKTQQMPARPQTNRTVEYVPLADCSNTVMRITYEIDPVTKRKREVGREIVPGSPNGQLWSWGYCHAGEFIRLRGRFVLVPHHKHHHPPIRWVRAGKNVGYVPRHPNDAKGKPPINLTHGVIVPSGKNDGTITRVAFNPSEKLKVLDQAPKEFQGRTVAGLSPVERPLIAAHFRNDNLPKTGLAGKGIVPGKLADAAAPKIQYDYKSHQFMQAGHEVAGRMTPPIPVGAMSSHGGIVAGSVYNPSTGVRSGGGYSGGSSGSHGSSGGGYGGGGSHGGGGGGGGYGGGGGGGSHH